MTDTTRLPVLALLDREAKTLGPVKLLDSATLRDPNGKAAATFILFEQVSSGLPGKVSADMRLVRYALEGTDENGQPRYHGGGIIATEWLPADG